MKKNKGGNNEKELTFAGHLKELRRRFLILLAVFVALFCIFLWKADPIIRTVAQLGKNAGYKLIMISPEESVVQELRIAAIAAFVIMLPVTIYEIIVFIAPAFEKKKTVAGVALFFAAGLIMFVIGAVFTYKVMLPFSLKYFGDIGNNLNLQSQISLEKYLNFVIAITLAIGISFDFPIVCLLLSFIGLVNADILSKARPWVVVGIFIVAAIITPPDVMTQFMVAIPLCVLYELSILLIKIKDRWQKTKEQQEPIVSD